jgi:glycosyltransferase involved in cell wall biosynthesis
MIGKGPAVEHMAELGEKYKAEGRFDMLGRVPNLVAATPHADIGLVAYPFDMLNHVYGAPNKIYEYSMSGLPVVVSNTPTLGAITRELKHGVLFDENDTTETLARKIQEAEKIKVDADEFCARIAVERDGTMADIRAKMKALFK